MTELKNALTELCDAYIEKPMLVEEKWFRIFTMKKGNKVMAQIICMFGFCRKLRREWEMKKSPVRRLILSWPRSITNCLEMLVSLLHWSDIFNIYLNL